MIYELDGVAPVIGAGAWIAPTAVLIGRVVIEPGASVWWGAVLRGDNEEIRLGAGSNIQENCVLHTDIGFPLAIGADCTIGHKAMLHGCTIEPGSLIGMAATVLNGARIGAGSLVGAGALVKEGTEIAPASLVVGAPCRVARQLDQAALDRLLASAAHYRTQAARASRGLKRLD
jgi:carbonic anhydrase/acetyltransferase-like protein (isoleucine patch superfamily)